MIPLLETRQEPVLLPCCLPPNLNLMDPSINTRGQIECSQGLPRLCLPFFYIRTEATLSTKCNGCVLSHVQLFATPWTVGHLSHAHHVPGTALVPNMDHLEQMVPSNNQNEVCQTPHLFYRQGNRDSGKLKVICQIPKNK